MKIFDDNFKFKVTLNRESVCWLRVWKNQEEVVVVATELSDNTGPSITNASEELANEVCKVFELKDPDKIIWIEHYPGTPSFTEHFDQVTFSKYISGNEFFLISPVWKYIKGEDVGLLVGERI